MKVLGLSMCIALLAGGCRVYEEAPRCEADPDDALTDDATEPVTGCTGDFFITDLEGNPAGKLPGSEAYIFDPEAFRHFDVEMAPDDWEWLRENALTEKYVPCAVVFEGHRYHGAAIRFKGAWTTLEGCFDEEGNQVCPKLSVKIRFNKYDPCGRFYGTRRLVFNSAVYDFSLMRERIAYEVIRNAGLEGPRAVHATLGVNGEDPSVYVLVEAPDKEFIQERWAKDEGNLYKEIWPAFDLPWRYEHALRTNELEEDVSGMMDFAAAVAGSTEESFSEDVAAYMDAGDMAWYTAVAQGIVDDDGILRFWCVDEDEEGNTICVNHNYYWYDDPGGLFRLIPWDMDTTFFEKKEAAEMTPEWWVLPDDCAPVPYHIWEGIEDPGPNDHTPLTPPQCDPVIGRSVRSNPYAYLEGLGDVAAAMEVSLADIPVYRARIAAAVAADPRLWHDMDEWDENVEWFGTVLEHQVETIEEVFALLDT